MVSFQSAPVCPEIAVAYPRCRPELDSRPRGFEQELDVVDKSPDLGDGLVSQVARTLLHPVQLGVVVQEFPQSSLRLARIAPIRKRIDAARGLRRLAAGAVRGIGTIREAAEGGAERGTLSARKPHPECPETDQQGANAKAQPFHARNVALRPSFGESGNAAGG